jgi:exodeoxyribonuclease V gamma subunit
MLHLHHAERLEPLLDALADVLAPTPPDPFTPDLVVVPAAGMRDAAMVGLGRRLGVSAPGAGDGIVANVEFVFPGRFMARAFGDATRDGDPDDDPWRLPRLTWSVLEELAAGSVSVPGVAVEDPWSLARRIADLFDRYATQRPRLVAGWAEGVDGDGTVREDGSPVLLDESHRWQAELWRAVRARLGVASPPERLPSLLDAIREGAVTPQLPQRLSVFGVGALSHTMAQLLRVLAHRREVHVFLRHPSMAAWVSSPHRLGGLNPRTNVDVTIAVANPLLASWGRPSLEARALLNGLPDVDDLPHHHPADVASTTLLGALQRSVQHDTAPTSAHVDAADGTLFVHACHGELRQLEVLRDALGHRFAADPTLQPHQVLVLCPDLQRFAPLVQAVFARGSLPIPVRVGDRSLTSDEPVIDALHAVLTLVSGRATLSEVLALVQFEPVRRRFGWTIDDVEQLAGWCDTLGAKWGFSADHRVAWGLPDHVTTGTWRATVDQLLAGLALAAPTPRLVIGDVAPFDDLSTGQFELVGTLAELLARLVDLHHATREPLPVNEWIGLLHEVIDDFCAADPEEPWRRQYVHRELTDMLATCAVPISLTGVRALLSDALSDRPGRLPLRSGAVTVSSMVPQHGVPARVVCLLGLDDGALRGGTFDGDDILGLRPCVGEPHPRHESRQLLLDALLAAGDQLIITCNGADLTTNKELPFIVPLVELLDVVGRLLGGDPSQVVVRHPRHGFNERALQPGVLLPGAAEPFTFDTTMLNAAHARRRAQRSTAQPTTSQWLLAPEPLGVIDVDRLVEVLANPSRTYLRDRLEVAVPGESSVAEDGLAITIDPLAASSLGRDLLQVRRRGGGADEWQAAARLNGSLPPAALSISALLEVREEVEAIETVAANWGVPLVGGSEVLVDLLCAAQIDGQRVEVPVAGRVRGIADGPDGPRLVDLRFTRQRPSFRLAAAVQLAVLQLQQPSVLWSGVIVARGDKKGDRPFSVGVRVRGRGSEQQQHASEVVSMAIELLAWARRDAVPYFDRTSADIAAGSVGPMYADLESDQRDRFVSLLWPDVSVEALLTDPVLATDPRLPYARSSSSRAEAVARWVWDTAHEAIEYFDE